METNIKRDDTTTRLIRLESKLVRGFEEMGIDINVVDEWLYVNDDQRSVHLKTLGRSIKVMLEEMKRCGASYYGDMYTIYFKKQQVGSIRLIEE